MGENSTENPISPVQSVESSPPKVRRPLLSRIPLLSRLINNPTTEVATDITPAAVQTIGFTPELPASTPAVESSPVNADAPEFSVAPSAPIDAVVNDVQKDLTTQMAAHVSNPFPGARPPEMASGFAAPTNPPTETATDSPIVAEAGAVAPTPIRTENPLEPPTPTAST